MFRAIGEVDEAMLQDAVAAAAQPVKRRPPVRLLATAACAVLLAAAVLGAVAPVLAPKGGAGEMNTAGTQQDEMTSDAALPEFSLKEANGAGFGMEAVMVREESELVPTAWPVSSGETPASLPVYENARPADATGARAYTQEELSALAQQTAAALGFEVERVELSPTEAQRQATMERFEAAAEKQAQLDYNLAPDSAAAVCTNGAVVTASRTGTVRVELAEGFDAAPYTQDAQAYAAAVQRLADEYGAAFGMQAPQAAVQADYTVEGNVHLTNFVWDAAASPAQQLLFASCGRLSFSAGESGAILYEQPQPGRALGEYALISESEARAMLLQGQCLTSVPYAVESEADIAAVELCYREGSEVYAPWYRFWVKLPEEAQQNCAPGCTVYGAYYVPAVRGEYIAGAPAA